MMMVMIVMAIGDDVVIVLLMGDYGIDFNDDV